MAFQTDGSGKPVLNAKRGAVMVIGQINFIKTHFMNPLKLPFHI